MREYVESPPGVTNLAAHYPASALTHLFCRGFSDAKTLVAAQLDQRRKDVDVSHEQLGNNEGRQREQVDHHLSLENKKREALLWKLRWSTLGYHYDWTSRYLAYSYVLEPALLTHHFEFREESTTMATRTSSHPSWRLCVNILHVSLG